MLLEPFVALISTETQKSVYNKKLVLKFKPDFLDKHRVENRWVFLADCAVTGWD